MPFAMLGLLIGFYVLATESKLHSNPGYQPSCDIMGLGSCSKVFMSGPAHILSYWGLVPRGHALDLSLGECAIPYFLVMGAYIFFRPYPAVRSVYRLLIVVGPCFTMYLGYLLKVEVQEFCIVCATTYVVNACLCFAIFKDLRYVEGLTYVHEERKSK